MSGSGPSRVVTKEAVWRGEGKVGKKREESGEKDQTVVPALQGQRGAAAPVRPGVQPGELAVAVGAAAVDPQLEPDHLAREAGEDRGQGCGARQVCHLPAGGGGGAPPALRGDSGADRAA